MKTIKGPAIFLAQFVGEEPPFNNLENICKWAASLGYKGVQIPTWEPSLIDIKKAAESAVYCDEIKGIVEEQGLEIAELSAHLQGQLVATHPAYDLQFDGFAPAEYHNDPKARTEWAINQVKYAAKASNRMGLTTLPSFSGALLWPTLYPWPQRPEGLVEKGFQELAKKWLPILDYCDELGIDVCYEAHPCEDIHDGVTFERFLEATNNHSRANLLYDPSHFVLQCLDYLDFIDIYHDRIKSFHVKDAEFNPNGKSGVYGGYQSWIDRPGRFRSLGDGQVDFKSIFSKLTQYGCDSWAVLEWECCLKNPEDGAKEGAQFIKDHIIQVTDKTFDDFAGGQSDDKVNKTILGLD